MRSKEYYEKKLEANGCVEEYEAIICPHCFQKEDDPRSLSLDDDGDEENDFICQGCGKLMDIKVHVEKTYTTTKIEDEE